MKFINNCFTCKTRTFHGPLLILLFFFSAISGCKKLVEVPPPVTSINSANVYSTDATAIAAVTGIYSALSNYNPYSSQLPGMSGLAGLSADELTLYSGVTGTSLNLYYINNRNSKDGLDLWSQLYPIIYIANAAIEGLTGSSSLSAPVKQQLLGEAEFDRALCYFYLVNLYGDVPLVLTTSYTVNATLARTPSTQVWQQIIQDLHSASALLSPNYLDGTLLNNTKLRVRPTSWAATALLARSYLYTGNWSGADSAASAVIGNPLYSLDVLNGVFLINSPEAIWQLREPYDDSGFDTPDALAFIIPPTGPDNGPHVAYLNDSLVTSFEANDQRKAAWIDSVTVSGVTYYYPFKYKNDSLNSPITEYTVVMRLAEQYLIRAEAEAELNDLTDAASDINMIRTRAGLGNVTANTQADLFTATMHERRVELFTEWGHRWLDLKRTGLVNTVMGTDGACAAKGGTWSPNWQWYPIPYNELLTDPQLVQNPGY